jgi:hypothetical protein
VVTEPGHGHHRHGPTGPGSVILDIGDAIGALIIETPAALHGHEIEISLVDHGAGTAGTADTRTHSQVRERISAAGTRYAAVYPGLAAGRYLIWRHMSTPVAEVTVDGGMVTCFRWPD